jgi:hypothetical protein
MSATRVGYAMQMPGTAILSKTCGATVAVEYSTAMQTIDRSDDQSPAPSVHIGDL